MSMPITATTSTTAAATTTATANGHPQKKKVLRVPTNYQLFVRSNRNIVEQQILFERHQTNGGVNVDEFNGKRDYPEKPKKLHLLVASRLGEIWRGMSPEQKNKFTIKRDEIIQHFKAKGVEFINGNRKKSSKASSS